jgi:hypothetical protein
MRNAFGWVIGALLLSACGGTVQSGTANNRSEPGDSGSGAGNDHGIYVPSGGFQNGGAGFGGSGNSVGYGGLPEMGGTSSGGAVGIASGGAVGRPVDGGSGGSEGHCIISQDVMLIQVNPPSPIGDAGTAPVMGEAKFTGVVTKVDPGQIYLDTCAGDPACKTNPSASVSVDAKGLNLELALSVGSIAHVQYIRACNFGCIEGLLISSWDTFNGISNSQPSPSGFYLAAANGDPTVVPDQPFTMTPRKLDCVTDFGAGCGTADTVGAYSLVFEGGTELFMGTGPQTFALKGSWIEGADVRSYQTGYCDAGWDLSYWVLGGPFFVPGD